MSNSGQWHSRNKHKNGYDFKTLCLSTPELSKHLITKPNEEVTINFSLPEAVKTLNKALLESHYRIKEWELPPNYLCPGVPGRVDYIHYLADLLKSTVNVVDINSNKVKLLDIGTGASCIYPLLGASEYNWKFIASDIDPISIDNANRILSANAQLKNNVTCRLQTDENFVFKGIIHQDEFFAFTLCNPPFHQSQKEANLGSERKWKNLKQHQDNNKSIKNSSSPTLNFGGQNAELWCEGGEVKFIRNMIRDSKGFRNNVLWFTSLVSKKDNLSAIKLSLKKAKVSQIKVIKMTQGQKITRIICWSFMDDIQQREWAIKQLVGDKVN